MDISYDNPDNNRAEKDTSADQAPALTGDYPVRVHFYELTKMYMHSINWHWHPEIEILIVNHGNVVFRTNDSMVSIGPGEGVIINANVMHSILSSDPDANCSMYSTVFHPSFLFQGEDSGLSSKYLQPVLENPDFKFITLDEGTANGSRMLECINGVIANNLVKNFGYELSTKAKLCDFWISLLGVVFPDTEASSRKVSGAIPLDESRAKDLISFIEDHYSEKITLDELAASVHISKSECCRCFKRALNVTPIEYLMKYRIYMAANLIRNKDPKASSFSDLAYHVGFNNASYFNKVFKQYLNCTPSAYKRKLRQDPNFDPFNNIV